MEDNFLEEKKNTNVLILKILSILITNYSNMWCLNEYTKDAFFVSWSGGNDDGDDVLFFMSLPFILQLFFISMSSN